MLYPTALLVLTALSAAFVAGRSRAFSPVVALLVFLLVTFSNKEVLETSPLRYAAVLVSLWGFYAWARNSLFWGTLLISAASLLYPPLVWLLPVLLLSLPFLEGEDRARKAVKSLGGWMLPYIYLFSYLILFKGNAPERMAHILETAIEIKLPPFSFSIPDLALLLCLLLSFFHAGSTIIMSFIERPDRRLLEIAYIQLFFAIAIYILFSAEGTAVAQALFALPLSLILSYHFKNCAGRRSARAELVLTCILSLIAIAEKFTGLF